MRIMNRQKLGPSLFILITLLSMTPRANAQELLGKTIKGTFSAASCLKRICGATLHMTFNIYVSAKGHVYDFTSPEQGVEYTLGVPDSKGDVFSLNGNTLKFTMHGGKVIFAYTANGSTCSIEQINGDRRFHTQTKSQTCVVVDGVSPKEK